MRMAEWIELLHALGADKIFLYDLGVHPNVTKVVDKTQHLMIYCFEFSGIGPLCQQRCG